jgi:hypothetical protein
MTFKPLETADFPLLKPYFADQPFSLSIYSLASLIAWSDCASRTSYCLEDGVLLIANEPLDKPEDRHLIVPFVPGGPLEPAELFRIAERHGYRSYWFVPEDYISLYGRADIDAHFLVQEQREFEDYVYLTQDLAELRGNRYAKKRNLIHQFTKEYLNRNRVQVEAMGPDSQAECLDFLEQWCIERDCDSPSNWALSCEKKAAEATIRSLRELEAEGLLVRIDGRVTAFGIRTRLNAKIGILNFEKAFARIKGLYQFLDRECAKRLFDGYLYISKESDMNIAELAQSRMSYHPVLRVQSYLLALRPSH